MFGLGRKWHSFYSITIKFKREENDTKEKLQKNVTRRSSSQSKALRELWGGDFIFFSAKQRTKAQCVGHSFTDMNLSSQLTQGFHRQRSCQPCQDQTAKVVKSKFHLCHLQRRRFGVLQLIVVMSSSKRVHIPDTLGTNQTHTAGQKNYTIYTLVELFLGGNNFDMQPSRICWLSQQVTELFCVNAYYIWSTWCISLFHKLWLWPTNVINSHQHSAWRRRMVINPDPKDEWRVFHAGYCFQVAVYFLMEWSSHTTLAWAPLTIHLATVVLGQQRRWRPEGPEFKLNSVQ